MPHSRQFTIRRLESRGDFTKLSKFATTVFIESYPTHSQSALKKYCAEEFSVDTLLIKSQLTDVHYFFVIGLSGTEDWIGFTHEICLSETSLIETYLPDIPMKTSTSTRPLLFLNKIYINSKFQGQGYGSVLLKYFLRNQQTKNADAALMVWNKNVRAIKLYEKFGFQKQQLVTFDLAGVSLTDYFMIRPLNPEHSGEIN